MGGQDGQRKDAAKLEQDTETIEDLAAAEMATEVTGGNEKKVTPPPPPPQKYPGWYNRY